MEESWTYWLKESDWALVGKNEVDALGWYELQLQQKGLSVKWVRQFGTPYWLDIETPGYAGEIYSEGQPPPEGSNGGWVLVTIALGRKS